MGLYIFECFQLVSVGLSPIRLLHYFLCPTSLICRPLEPPHSELTLLNSQRVPDKTWTVCVSPLFSILLSFLPHSKSLQSPPWFLPFLGLNSSLFPLLPQGLCTSCALCFHVVSSPPAGFCSHFYLKEAFPDSLNCICNVTPLLQRID